MFSHMPYLSLLSVVGLKSIKLFTVINMPWCYKLTVTHYCPSLTFMSKDVPFLRLQLRVNTLAYYIVSYNFEVKNIYSACPGVG